MMKTTWLLVRRLTLLAGFAAAIAAPAGAQVDGLSSCQRTFDQDPATAPSSVGTCGVTGIVFLGEGRQTFFDVVGSARIVRALGSDSYDVELTLSASGDFPEGFLFGHGQVRSTNGDICDLDLARAFSATTCPSMFSSDGAFTVFVDAFSGVVPG